MVLNLVIDSNFLCYRALFTMGELSADEARTGVIFGFLLEVLKLAKKFNTNKFFFCWDSRKSKRRRIYPDYKQRGKEKTPDEIVLIKEAYQQFTILRTEILLAMGFRNNFIQAGLESDDLMACLSLIPKNRPMTIVSPDEDLLQMLDYGVDIWTGKKLVTRDSFSS